MIIELLFNLISVLLKILFSWVNLPQIPSEAETSINQYLDMIFDNLDFLGFFIRPNTLTIVATSAIALWTFSKLYKVTMWIYHKLPISSN